MVSEEEWISQVFFMKDKLHKEWGYSHSEAWRIVMKDMRGVEVDD